jgi:virulence-associated protein VapD
MHVRRSRARCRMFDLDETPPDAFDGRNLPNTYQWAKRVYAIAFDLDINELKNKLGESAHTGAYHSLRRVFEEYGFTNQQGSLYFGNDKTTPVTCVLAVQEASKRFSWFRYVVNDIRMLRIEENNDLYPALGEPELPFPSAPVPISAE